MFINWPHLTLNLTKQCYLLSTARDAGHVEWRKGSTLASRIPLSCASPSWTTDLGMLFDKRVQVAQELSDMWKSRRTDRTYRTYRTCHVWHGDCTGTLARNRGTGDTRVKNTTDTQKFTHYKTQSSTINRHVIAQISSFDPNVGIRARNDRQFRSPVFKTTKTLSYWACSG